MPPPAGAIIIYYYYYKVNVPVIGGHSGVTILPLLSQVG